MLESQHGYLSLDEVKLCRRLYLRSWTPSYLDGIGSVDVSVFVYHSASNSEFDDINQVVDYNVMREALIKVKPIFSRDDCGRVAQLLISQQGIHRTVVSMVNIEGDVHVASAVKDYRWGALANASALSGLQFGSTL